MEGRNQKGVESKYLKSKPGREVEMKRVTL